ncbi:hypothetical protein MCHLDSM_01504 [Mycolicibacterium chlorophenolicum]|uniref:Lsr2 DNA-binding domain-containing protein n=1 Tax=Mycolicibacterium chlorophenolicum TaxID=37916 RepID=A0A0J6ZBP8_9MYCO|nr:hypothetical protein MCHLDSM_01504 [Mycolicibacterium chlorophenolicum]
MVLDGLAEEWTYRFLAAARTWTASKDVAVQQVQSAGIGTGESGAEPSSAEVWAWARGTGLPVPDRGRLRPDVWSAWRAAHGATGE